MEDTVQDQLFSISLVIIILLSTFLYIFAQPLLNKPVFGNFTTMQLLYIAILIVVVSFFVRKLSIFSFLFSIFFLIVVGANLTGYLYVQSSPFANFVEGAKSGVTNLETFFKDFIKTLQNPWIVIESKPSGEKDVQTITAYNYKLEISPNDDSITLFYKCLDSKCTTVKFDKIIETYKLKVKQPYKISFNFKCNFTPRTNCLLGVPTVSTTSLQSEEGEYTIACYVEPFYNYSQDCLDKNGSVLYETISGKVILEVNYTGYSDSEMYFLIVKKEEKSIADSMGKDIYSYLGLDRNKYFKSKYIGTTGSYVSIGIEKSEPIVLSEDEQLVKLKITIEDEESGLLKIDNLTIYLPGWLGIQSDEDYSCHYSGTVDALESATANIKCVKKNQWICNLSVDNSKLKDLEVITGRIFFSMLLCVNRSALEKEGFREGKISAHYEYLYHKEVPVEFTYMRLG